MCHFSRSIPFLCVLVVGCDRTPPAAPTSSPLAEDFHRPENAVSVPVADSIRALIDQQSSDAFRTLLTANDTRPPDQFALRSAINRGNGPASETGIVSQPSRIVSLGTQYIVVPLTSYVTISGGRVSFSQAFVFTPEGRLMGSFGTSAAAGQSSDMVDIISLGTRDTWFVQVSRWSSAPPFDMVTDVHMITPRFPRVLRVAHFANGGMGFTSTRKEAEAQKGHVFLFYDPRKPLEPPKQGVDQRGQKQWPKLTWDPSRRRFTGPSSVIRDTRPLYRVDLAGSEKFDAVDQEVKSDSKN